ncbi:hypothetical protein KHP62_03750 [Rhodobacteraceae bacterium NNCM2]|nr:hypothetical protein [Coraliihabitans acroporae]
MDDTEIGRITQLFTRADGSFRFARWGRPLAPVVYGTNDGGMRIFEENLAGVAGLAGLEIRDLDPELGANFMVFFSRDWAELLEVPHLEKLIPNLGQLVADLSRANANQYRIFGFDEQGAIRICITLLRYDDDLQQISAQTLAVSQSYQGMLLWSDSAFAEESPIALLDNGRCIVKPWYADVVRAAYDPVLPACAGDASFGLRLAARMGRSEDEG